MRKKTRKQRLVLCICLLITVLISSTIFLYLKTQHKCAFFRNNQCFDCNTPEIIPVAYKENCTKCPNRIANYTSNGLLPAYLCLFKEQEKEFDSETTLPHRSTIACPKNKPLKDVLGNCYSCTSEEIIRIAPTKANILCQNQRYILPDNGLEKSVRCPTLSDLQDAEACVRCNGKVSNHTCFNHGENHFCNENSDCPDHQWCYPFKIHYKGHSGICTDLPKTSWICSQTDGYDLKSAQEFCKRQGAHIPTLEEIETAEEDLSILCPTLDMWTFFAPDGAVWLESFAHEFLFTREGETENLGGHQFYALCHKD